MKKNYAVRMLSLLMISLFALTITSFESFEKSPASIKAKMTDPIFAITPQSIMVPACSALPVTFSCNVINGVSGLGWRYYWTVGTGWTLPAGEYPTLDNKITLTPVANGTGVLSVSVIVVDSNARNYSGGLALLSRQVFSSNAVINGEGTSICSGGSQVFNITGLKTGETVAWSLSNPNQASITNSTATQATVQYNGSGNLGDLIAAITNTCGQSVQKRFALYSGAPNFAEFTCNSFEGHDFCSGVVGVPYTYLPSLSVSDKITASFSGMTSTERTNSANWEWQPVNNNITISKTLNIARIGMMNFGQTGVRVRAKNACGWSAWQQLDFEIVELPEVMSKSSKVNGYEVYPNPTNDLINIKPKEGENFINKNKESVLAEVYDVQGMLIKQFLVSGKKGITIATNGLKKGIYLLKINTKDKIENHRIVVE